MRTEEAYIYFIYFFSLIVAKWHWDIVKYDTAPLKVYLPDSRNIYYRMRQKVILVVANMMLKKCVSEIVCSIIH